jgi:hypothetical protein
MTVFIHIQGSLFDVNRYLDDLSKEEIAFMQTAPEPILSDDGDIAPDTHVEVVSLLISLGTNIVGGVVVGVIKRAVIDRLIGEGRSRGLKVVEVASNGADTDEEPDTPSLLPPP